MNATATMEPAWLNDMRRKAWEAYQDLDLPDRSSHLWRYTDPGRFLPAGDPLATTAKPVGHDVSPWCDACRGEFSGDTSLMGISVNGWTHRISVPERLADGGLILKDLRQAVTDHEDLVEAHLARFVPWEENKFESLNLAAWQSGFFLYVPRGLDVEAPVHLFVTNDGREPISTSRILVVMEKESSLTLFTELSSKTDGDAACQVNTVIELAQGEASRLQHVNVQRLAPNARAYQANRADLDRDARLVSVVTTFGGAVTKLDTGAVMSGEGAESELTGFAFGEADQHFDHHTMYDHRAPHTSSNLNFKVVLKDKSRSAYTGLLRVAEDAPYCNAYQENRNILLSDKTRADSIPELEIMTDEVHCSHGATVGPLDPEHLFYIMSRGIPEEEAIRVMIGGFLEPALSMIPGRLQGMTRRCVAERLREF